MSNNNDAIIEKGLEVLRIAEEDLSQQGIELSEIEFQEIEFLEDFGSNAVKFTFIADEYEYDEYGDFTVVPVSDREKFDETIGKTIQLADVYYVNAFIWTFLESEDNKYTCWLPFRF